MPAHPKIGAFMVCQSVGTTKKTVLHQHAEGSELGLCEWEKGEGMEDQKCEGVGDLK